MLGSTLRKAREARGLSLSEMARFAHASKSVLSLYERGLRPVPTDVIWIYRRVTGDTTVTETAGMLQLRPALQFLLDREAA